VNLFWLLDMVDWLISNRGIGITRYQHREARNILEKNKYYTN